MTNQPIPAIVPPVGGAVNDDDSDRPLDPDVDEDQIDSAEADEQAASQGTLQTDEDA